MLKRLLVVILLLIPTICFADSIWGTRYNSWTRTNDWYKNSVSSSNFATNSDKLDGYHASEIIAISTGLAPTPDLTSYVQITDSPTWSGSHKFNYGINIASYVYIAEGKVGFWNIKDKYIVTDATTSAQFQTLINYVSEGTHIAVIPSTISVNSQINIFKNNITIEGLGEGVNFVSLAWVNWTSAGHVFYSSGTSGLTIRAIKIDGLSSNTGQTKNLIHLQLCSYVTLDHLWLTNSDNHCMYIEGSNFVKVEHNTFTNFHIDGCRFYGYDYIFGAYSGGYNSEFSHNQLKDGKSGVTVQYCRTLKVSSNYIYNMWSWGVQADQLNYGITIIDNVVIGGTGGGVYFYGSGTSGFVCSANVISCSGIGILVQGGISAGSLTNNSIVASGNGIEIGSYDLVSNINVIGNSILAGNTKAAINAYEMSNSLVAFNNCSNVATGNSEQAFLLQKGTGNVIVSNIAKFQDTADFQINAFCYDNKLFGNIANGNVKIIDNGRATCLQTYQDCKWGFGVSSPTVTVDILGAVKVTTGMYPAQAATLPTTGYTEGSLFYCTNDKKTYHSTETVTGSWSWVTP